MRNLKDKWDDIFDKLQILPHLNNNPYFDITAEEIKTISSQEPRLMTKIDFREDLPTIMKNNRLSILAIKNGVYRIAQNDPFIDISDTIHSPIHIIKPPENILTIDPFNIKSESAALDIASVSGMLDNVFGEITQLTIRGRLRGSLDFTINSIHYPIDGVQIEVDGGYEGETSINLIEAKIGFRKNMTIRQLLYPELMWKNQINSQKRIQSFIFFYQDNIFRFIPFVYEQGIFNVNHTDEKAFKFQSDIQFSLNQINPSSNRLVNIYAPFPQANDFAKVHAILLNIANSECPSKTSVISEFDVVTRQADYYFNALKWLGLCDLQGECIQLTNKGVEILSMSIYHRMIEISKIIFSEPIFFKTLHNLEIHQNEFDQWNISGDTINRRLSTVRKWIEYFHNFFEISL